MSRHYLMVAGIAMLAASVVPRAAQAAPAPSGTTDPFAQPGVFAPAGSKQPRGHGHGRMGTHMAAHSLVTPIGRQHARGGKRRR